MPTPHKSRRNAKPKPKPKHAPRYRNAAPAPPRASALRRSASTVRDSAPVSAFRKSVSVPPEGPTLTEKLVVLGEALGGAALASVAGAYAVKWGFHPEWVSYGLAGVGALGATRKREIVRAMGTGAVSAAGSQLLLLKLAAPHAAPAQVAQQPHPPQQPQQQPPPQPHPTQTAQAPKLKNADLGALPPGVLDAAFERARAELAVSEDGSGPAYEYAPHHFHHGPVYPSR